MKKTKSLSGPLTGALSLVGYAVNTVFWCSALAPVALAKLALPLKSWRGLCSRALNGIANAWIAVNNLNIRLASRAKWQIHGLETLKKNRWYLVLSNHQSWTDILVLQKVFFRKIPFLKFFIKRSLIWVPVLGLAWWALDFPFMKRYSKKILAKHPEWAGRDLATTKKACEKFADHPISIMNFVEGTRFSPTKRDKQNSPYQQLLRPKSGGIAFVLGAMGDKLTRIINVTISYPKGPKSFWDFVCGRISEVRVKVESLPITPDLLGDYFGDADYRQRFQDWLNELWRAKDQHLGSMAALPVLAGQGRIKAGE